MAWARWKWHRQCQEWFFCKATPVPTLGLIQQSSGGNNMGGLLTLQSFLSIPLLSVLSPNELSWFLWTLGLHLAPSGISKAEKFGRQDENKSCWSLGPMPHPSLAECMDKTYVFRPILLPVLFPLPFHYIFYWTLWPYRVSCGIQSKIMRSILLWEGNFNTDVGGIRTSPPLLTGSPGDETACSAQSQPHSLYSIKLSYPNGASLTQSPVDSPCDTLVQCSLSAVIKPNKVL